MLTADVLAKIDRIDALALSPGDILRLSAREIPPQAETDCLQRVLAEYLGFGILIIVTRLDERLDALPPEAMRRAGWVRAEPAATDD